MTREHLYFEPAATADIRFPTDAWEQAQRELAPAEPVLRELGRKHGLELLSDLTGRVVWPARRLQARGLSWETQVRLLVNPNYFNDGRWFYALVVERTAGLGWFRKSLPHFRGRTYAADELRDPARLARDVEELIGLMGLAKAP